MKKKNIKYWASRKKHGTSSKKYCTKNLIKKNIIINTFFLNRDNFIQHLLPLTANASQLISSCRVEANQFTRPNRISIFPKFTSVTPWTVSLGMNRGSQGREVGGNRVANVSVARKHDNGGGAYVSIVTSRREFHQKR